MEDRERMRAEFSVFVMHVATVWPAPPWESVLGGGCRDNNVTNEQRVQNF